MTKGKGERQRIAWRADSRDALAAKYESELRHKRAFVPGAFIVGERELCILVLGHPDRPDTFELDAEAVWHKADEPGAGVGLALLVTGNEKLAALERFVHAEGPAVEPAPVDSGVTQDARDTKNLYDRIRNLSVRERETVARQGALHERVALERVWGGAVWELLLQNRQLTAAEVAQIARNPGLASAQIATIVGVAGWLSKAEVQQALLQNPRVTGPQLDRVVKTLSKNELARLAAQPSVRQAVRAAAKKLGSG